MADPVIIARRRAIAIQRFDDVAAKLTDRLGLQPPEALPPVAARDPELKRVRQLEQAVEVLEQLDAKLPEGFKLEEPKPPPPAKPVAKANPTAAKAEEPKGKRDSEAKASEPK